MKTPEEKAQQQAQQQQQQTEQKLAPPSLVPAKSSDPKTRRFEMAPLLKHSTSLALTPPDFRRHGSSLRSFSQKSVIFDEEKVAELNQAREKNQIIQAIYEFYEKHTEGPGKLVEKLIQDFKDMTFHENSLRSLYEHLSELVSLSMSLIIPK